MTRTKALLVILAILACSTGFADYKVFVLSDSVSSTAKQAVREAGQIQTGRVQGVLVTCAALSAVAEAGRQVIAGNPNPPPGAQERALEQLGFPPFKTRHAESEAAADAYVANLAASIDRQTGHHGDRLVLPGGRIDCRAFLKLVNAR